MSLSGLFNIGKSTIFGSQTALSVISNNIANVNTPGYSRHDAILEVANPVQIRGNYIGRGLGEVHINRHYDKFLHLQILDQSKSYGRSYALDRGLSHLEQVFNETRDIGLASSLNEFLNAWQDVANNPESQPQRSALLQRAKALVQTAQLMDSDMVDTLSRINGDIDLAVNEINAITSNISTLNKSITQVEAGTNDEASYFRDERDRLLNQLAELIDYTWYEDTSGTVSVLAGGNSLVDITQSYNLTTQVNLDGHREIYTQAKEISSVFQKGQLGGYLSLRNDIETDSLFEFRRLVASITKELNAVHSTGYGLDNTTGNNFFSALQMYSTAYSANGYVQSSTITNMSSLTLDEYDITFSSPSNYQVTNRQTGSVVTSGTYSAGSPINFDGIQVVLNGAPATNDRFLISPLQDVISDFSVAITDTQKIAASAASANLPGDNSKALEIVNLFQTGISNLSGTTFAEYYQGIVSDIGIMSKAAKDSLTYDNNLLFELNQKRDSKSGVSLDEEAANLLRYQRMYEAGAKVIQVTDELMEMIINL